MFVKKMGWFFCASRKGQIDNNKNLFIKLCFLFRRSQRQRSNPTPESLTPTIGVNRLAPLDLHQSVATSNKTSMHPTAPTTSSVVATSEVGKSNSLPGHQSSRSKITNHRLLDQQALNLSDSVNKN